MHRNYRRKYKPGKCLQGKWSYGKFIKEEATQRVRTRRQRDRVLLMKGEWDEIRKFEKPVDWYSIH